MREIGNGGEVNIVAPVRAEVHEVDLGSHRIAYAELGSGKPIVLLHGGLMDHQSWGNQLPLARRFRLILPDTRGHGRSGGADLPATYAAFGEDAIGLMDALSLARAHIVGFSDGGCAALHMALKHPGRLSGLVLIGTPYNLASYNGGVVDRFRTMVPQDMENTGRPLVREVIAKMRHHMSEEDWHAYWRRIVRGLWVREPDFALSEFAAMPVRTLILHGEHERSVRAEASRELAATMPDCRLEFVPGATHSAAQDAPAIVNEAISRFLDAGS